MTALQLAFEGRLIVRSLRSEPNIDNVLSIVKESPKDDLSALCPTTDASLLFYAAQRPNDSEAVTLSRLLCEELVVCDPRQADRNQQTALFFAARDGNAECVTYLAKNGCDPNHRDSALQTALFYAARDGRVKAVKALLDNGADVNSVDHLGQTALFYGSRDGRTETVALMLERGANLNVRDRHRRTALYYAMRNNHKELASLLKAAGSIPGVLSPGDTENNIESKSVPSITTIPPRPTKRARLGSTDSIISNTGPPAPTPSSNGKSIGLQPIRRRCYRLAIRTPFSQADPHNLLWIGAPVEFIRLFETLAPSVSVWSKEAPCKVPDILNDVRANWQPIAISILDDLSQMEGGWIFSKPVDCKAWGCPDYYDVIQTPMDFATMKKKFKTQGYDCCSDFMLDMELIFSNCFRYNRPESHVASIGRTIQTQFKTLCVKKDIQGWLEIEDLLKKWYTETTFHSKEHDIHSEVKINYPITNIPPDVASQWIHQDNNNNDLLGITQAHKNNIIIK